MKRKNVHLEAQMCNLSASKKASRWTKGHACNFVAVPLQVTGRYQKHQRRITTLSYKDELVIL
jgi:hypothetical protein